MGPRSKSRGQRGYGEEAASEESGVSLVSTRVPSVAGFGGIKRGRPGVVLSFFLSAALQSAQPSPARSLGSDHSRASLRSLASISSSQEAQGSETDVKTELRYIFSSQECQRQLSSGYERWCCSHEKTRLGSALSGQYESIFARADPVQHHPKEDFRPCSLHPWNNGDLGGAKAANVISMAIASAAHFQAPALAKSNSSISLARQQGPRQSLMS